jgi:hypothetical protein
MTSSKVTFFGDVVQEVQGSQAVGDVTPDFIPDLAHSRIRTHNLYKINIWAIFTITSDITNNELQPPV